MIRIFAHSSPEYPVQTSSLLMIIKYDCSYRMVIWIWKVRNSQLASLVLHPHIVIGRGVWVGCYCLVTGSPYNSCGPICLIRACSNPSLSYLLSDERWLLIPPYLAIFPTPSPHPFPPPLLTCEEGWGGLSNMAGWATTTRPTRDKTNLGLNKP